LRKALGFGIWDLGFGIWDLGFGISDFGFWILDFGFWISESERIRKSQIRNTKIALFQTFDDFFT